VLVVLGPNIKLITNYYNVKEICGLKLSASFRRVRNPATMQVRQGKPYGLQWVKEDKNAEGGI
jgi:hypothetical protein